MFVKGSPNVNTTNHNKVPTVCITHAMYSMGQQWTMKLRQEKECSTFVWFKCYSLAFYYIHGPDYSAYRYQTILILLVLKLKGNGSKVTSAYCPMWINGMLLKNMCATCFITKRHTFTISYPNRPKDLFWFEVLTCFYLKDPTMPMESASHHLSGHMLQYSRCSSSWFNADLLDNFMKHQLQSNMFQTGGIPRSNQAYCAFIVTLIQCAPVITQPIFSKFHEMGKLSSSVRARHGGLLRVQSMVYQFFYSGIGTNKTNPCRYPSVKGAFTSFHELPQKLFCCAHYVMKYLFLPAITFLLLINKLSKLTDEVM